MKTIQTAWLPHDGGYELHLIPGGELENAIPIGIFSERLRNTEESDAPTIIAEMAKEYKWSLQQIYDVIVGYSNKEIALLVAIPKFLPKEELYGIYETANIYEDNGRFYGVNAEIGNPENLVTKEEWRSVVDNEL